MIEQIERLFDSIRIVEKEAQDLSKKINRGSGGREISLAITALQQSRQWTQEAHDVTMKELNDLPTVR